MKLSQIPSLEMDVGMPSSRTQNTLLEPVTLAIQTSDRSRRGTGGASMNIPDPDLARTVRGGSESQDATGTAYAYRGHRRWVMITADTNGRVTPRPGHGGRSVV